MNERGVALIITLIVIAVAATLALEFAHLTRLDAGMARNLKDGLKAYYLANSGISWAQAWLEKDGRTTEYDGLGEEWARGQEPVSLDGGQFSFSIEDEERKLNLNYLLKDGKVDEARHGQLARLIELLELDVEIAASIVDWIDADDEARPGGAEKDYYQGLERPYSPKNGPFATLEELKLVKGITSDVFEKLRPYLTVNSGGKVNINTAGKLILMSLSKDMDAGMAEDIISYRERSPFSKTSELKEVSKSVERVFTRISGGLDVKSESFSITSEGKFGDSRRGIRAIANRAGGKLNIVYWSLY